MDEDVAALEREFVRIAQRIYKRGLQGYTGGNLSVRLPGRDRIIIKRSGLSFADCSTTNLVTVDLQGNIVAGEGKPSKEVFAHLGVYRARVDVGAVLHIHPPWATTLAVMGVELPLLTVQAIEKLRSVPLIPYAPQGSGELSDLVSRAFRNHEVVAALMARHGLIVAGPTLAEVLHTAELVEETAQVGWLALYGRGGKL